MNLCDCGHEESDHDEDEESCHLCECLSYLWDEEESDNEE